MHNLHMTPWMKTHFEETVSLYITVFSAEPWNDELTQTQISDYVTALTEMNTFLGYSLIEENTNVLVGYAIGFIKPWYQGTEYVIDTLLLAPDHQGKGTGSTFMHMIEEDLRKKAIPTILLDTETNMPAATFYEKNGFKPLPENVTLYRSIK